MNKDWKTNGPVIIGGVGGSGTRVVAEILSIFGFFMGNDLNKANDNLLYTLIFKRPKWLYSNYGNKKQLGTGLSLFRKLTLKDEALTLAESSFLIRATISMAFFGHNHKRKGTGSWAISRLYNSLSGSKSSKQEYIGWGWKEPNSHLLIKELPRNFTNFKYIHTIRHGLDMSFSKNQQQLYNWGELYNVKVPSSIKEEPQASLKYWLKVHEKIIETTQSFRKDQFLLVDFDLLCSDPKTEILKIISFLDIDVDNYAYEQAIQLPKLPRSTGRFRQQDIESFSQNDLNSLAKFGFPLK